MGRDYDPIPGKWYEDLDENEVFQVLSVDPDQEMIEIQYDNGDIEAIELDAWHELDLDQATEPEGWSSSAAADKEGEDKVEVEEEEDDEDDWDDDDDDDDWDDDEDEDDDYSDRDDA